MSHKERIEREKDREPVYFSLREVEALLPVLAVGKIEIDAQELYSARQSIALDRAISKLHDIEVRLKRRASE